MGDEPYTRDEATLTFLGNAGETQTFTIPIFDDAIVEPDEILAVALASPSNSTVDTTATATVTIIDDDTATLSIADVTVDESGGTATISVAVDAEVRDGFTVDAQTANGTATAPGDYTDASPTLTFTGSAGEIQTFTVPITQDAIVESNETVLLSLLAASNPAVVTTDTATLTIIDDDSATLSIADVTVDESAGTATISVVVDAAVQGGFTVDVIACA